MKEKLTSNNSENDLFILTDEDSDYKELITRLKDIRETIALLEKKYLYKI